MNIIEVVYAPYKIKLKKNFTTSKGIIKERKGLILNIKDSDGLIGVGEAAPFPDFGSETYEESYAALDNLKIQLKIEGNNLIENLENSLSPLEKFPAMHHGFEQAILNLLSKKYSTTITKLLNINSSKEILVNAALGFLPPEESSKEADLKVNEGFSAIKLKVGRNTFNEDYECIKAVRNSVGKKIKLRIDTNGKWNLKEAVNNLNKLEEFNIEYAEQPVNSLKDFKELSSKTNIPLAADESIRNISDAKQFITEKASSFLILKPMMLGGIIPTLKIIELAKNNNIKIVITSTFESSIGKYISVLAASATGNNLAHGLAVNDYFENDLIENPFPIKNGKITLHNEL